jgi:rhodanese-related sulfurtransferase
MQISPWVDLVELLEGKDFVLVNTHLPYEGEPAQTDLLIPFDDISTHVDKLPEKDAKIGLYCRSGNMSTSVARELASPGFTNVAELDGGMRAWEESGLELLFEPALGTHQLGCLASSATAPNGGRWMQQHWCRGPQPHESAPDGGTL